MEMEPDPAEQVSETSWHPEIVVLVRDVKVRLYVKREGCLPDWQSQWVAGDAWLASRADIAATICSEKDKNSQLHSARNFGWFGVAGVFSNTNTKRLLNLNLCFFFQTTEVTKSIKRWMLSKRYMLRYGQAVHPKNWHQSDQRIRQQPRAHFSETCLLILPGYLLSN